MRVGIDATPAFACPRTGVETYAIELIHSLLNELRLQRDLQLYLYCHLGNPFVAPCAWKEVFSLVQGQPVRIRCYRLRRGYGTVLPLWAKLDRLDLLHMLLPRLPRLKACSTAVTVHDLAWAHLTGKDLEIEKVKSKEEFQNAIEAADWFIADSASTAKDLNSLFEINPQRIQVVHLGVDHLVRCTSSKADDTPLRALETPYVLYMGTIQHRKNLIRLVEAFYLLRSRSAVPHRLVLAGGEGNGYQMIRSAITRIDCDNRVLFLGYVPDTTRHALYSGADLCVFPSLYEGFGFPVLEALWHGVCVVTSHAASLPEVGGVLALYCDPLDVEDIAQKMYQGLTDQALINRTRIEGPMWSKRFTWQKTAQGTLAAYRSMTSKNRS